MPLTWPHLWTGTFSILGQIATVPPLLPRLTQPLLPRLTQPACRNKRRSLSTASSGQERRWWQLYGLYWRTNISFHLSPSMRLLILFPIPYLPLLQTLSMVRLLFTCSGFTVALFGHVSLHPCHCVLRFTLCSCFVTFVAGAKFSNFLRLFIWIEGWHLWGSSYTWMLRFTSWSVTFRGTHTIVCIVLQLYHILHSIGSHITWNDTTSHITWNDTTRHDMIWHHITPLDMTWHLATNHINSPRTTNHFTLSHLTAKHMASYHITRHITSPPPTHHGNTANHRQDTTRMTEGWLTQKIAHWLVALRTSYWQVLALASGVYSSWNFRLQLAGNYTPPSTLWGTKQHLASVETNWAPLQAPLARAIFWAASHLRVSPT